MAIVEDQMVEVKISRKNIDWYKAKDYQLEGKKSIFVRVNDLQTNSKAVVKINCDNCQKDYEKPYGTLSKNINHFCSQNCRYEYVQKHGSYNKNQFSVNCYNCKEEMNVPKYRYDALVNNELKYITCSRKCKSEYDSKHPLQQKERYEKICRHCNKTFYVVKSNFDKIKCCSPECGLRYRKSKSAKVKIKINCKMCDKDGERTPSQFKKSKNHFCSNECADKYNQLIKTVYNKCVSCEKWFSVQKSKAYQFCCSVKCQGVWQSKSLVGDKANNYKSNITKEMRIHKCDWCGNEMNMYPYRIENKHTNGKKCFCGRDCYREWYAKDWSQQESWKEESRKRTLGMLANGTFDHTDTLPQRILNSILDEMKTKYINEYTCLKVSIDNYLVDHNLMIEVHGRYWHCDPRYYSTIGYQRQYDRIMSDKRKKASIKANYGINILYLWEDDLGNNLEMCKELVRQYIDEKGVLDNYHSLNYTLENNKIKLVDNLTLPYSDYDSDSLHEIFIPVSGKRRSNKQLDKWLTFNCDFCGKEKEQLITHYNESKTHCCSKSCSYKLRKSI